LKDNTSARWAMRGRFEFKMLGEECVNYIHVQEQIGIRKNNRSGSDLRVNLGKLPRE